jgi:hypothetical protein
MNREMKFSRQDAQKARKGNSLFLMQSVRIAHACEDSRPYGDAVINAKARRRTGAPDSESGFLLCSAIPENCAFLAKFPERSSPMTNDKFSMTNSQFRLGVLVAACRAAPLRLCVETSFLSVKSV